MDGNARSTVGERPVCETNAERGADTIYAPNDPDMSKRN